MQPSSSTPKKSSTFGIIAIIISLIAFGTPRFLLSMVFIALAVFIIIGFFRDGNKLFSGIALLIGGFLFYGLIHTEIQEDEDRNADYQVTYEVDCENCDVSYTNLTGGTDSEHVEKGTWKTTETIKGDEFVHLNVRSKNDYFSVVNARIYVNGVFVDGEKSTGEYASVNVSCQPKDIYDKK